jgi:hypothetical protein
MSASPTATSLRAELADRLNLVGFYAYHAEDYAALGDDAALEYAMRCAVAHVRVAMATLKDLRECKAKGTQDTRRAA